MVELLILDFDGVDEADSLKVTKSSGWTRRQVRATGQQV